MVQSRLFVRVVKELHSKCNGTFSRRFESCSSRNYNFATYSYNSIRNIFIITVCQNFTCFLFSFESFHWQLFLVQTLWNKILPHSIWFTTYIFVIGNQLVLFPSQNIKFWEWFDFMWWLMKTLVEKGVCILM